MREAGRAYTCRRERQGWRRNKREEARVHRGKGQQARGRRGREADLSCVMGRQREREGEREGRMSEGKQVGM